MNEEYCPLPTTLDHHWQNKSIKKMVRLVVYQEDGPMGRTTILRIVTLLGALFSSSFSGFFLSRRGSHLPVPFLEESVSLVMRFHREQQCCGII
jgi:hypothetical protein